MAPKRPAAPDPRASPTSVHRLHVVLRHAEPPIWRDLVVPSACSLDDLNEALQAAFAWKHDHLHKFSTRQESYAPAEVQLDDTLDSCTAILGQVLPRKGAKLVYVYDFGDDWIHDVSVVAIEDAGPKFPRVAFTLAGGARAAPPEDSGGVVGYVDLLEAMADPDHAMHEDVLEEYGEPIDPEAFEPKTIEKALARLRKPAGKRSPR